MKLFYEGKKRKGGINASLAKALIEPFLALVGNGCSLRGVFQYPPSEAYLWFECDRVQLISQRELKVISLLPALTGYRLNPLLQATPSDPVRSSARPSRHALSWEMPVTHNHQPVLADDGQNEQVFPGSRARRKVR